MTAAAGAPSNLPRVEGIDDVEVGLQVERRHFRRTTGYGPTPGVFPTDLSRPIRLPALFARRDVVASDFPPDTWTAEAEPVRQAEQVLAESVRPKPASKADRRKRVELRPVWSDAEGAKADAPASDHPARGGQPPGTGSRSGASPFGRPGARAGGRR